MRNLIKNQAVIAPPAIILLGFLVALMANALIKAWAFIPLALVYWLSIVFVVMPDKKSVSEVMKKPQGKPVWRFLPYFPALFTLVAFVWGLRVITITPLLTALSMVFILINPVGGIALARLAVIPLPWCRQPTLLILPAVHSKPLLYVGCFPLRSGRMMLLPLIIMGTIWSITFLKSNSLRHCVIAHALVDTFNLSVWVFLNLYIPPVV